MEEHKLILSLGGYDILEHNDGKFEVYVDGEWLAGFFESFEGALEFVNARRIPLTEREREVLSCLARGMTNKQIAVELAREVSTIKAHLNELYRKLGVPNRAQAMLLALRCPGLLQPPGANKALDAHP